MPWDRGALRLAARGHAVSSCRVWMESDPGVTLDPIQLSPKLLAACQSTAPSASASASASAVPSARPR